MPAHVCILCRVVYVAGSLPASHGVCPPCLLAEDPDAAEELAAECTRHPALNERPIARPVRYGCRENAESYLPPLRGIAQGV